MNVGWLIVIIAIAVLYQGVIGWILTQLTGISNPHYKWNYGVVNALVAFFPWRDAERIGRPVCPGVCV